MIGCVLLAASLIGFAYAESSRVEYVGSDPLLSSWLDEAAPVSVFGAENKINSMALSSAIAFDVYHLGLVFYNERAREWFALENFMETSEDIPSMYMPTDVDPAWHELPLWQILTEYLSGEAVKYFRWKNFASVRLSYHGKRKPREYSELTLVGSTTVGDLKSVMRWAIVDFAGDSIDGSVDSTLHYSTPALRYDVWGLYSSVSGDRIRRSRMCYDFVEEILERLNLSLEPNATLLREGVMMSVDWYRPLDLEGNAKHRRDFLRFLRIMNQHIRQIGSHLIFTRMVIAKLSLLGLPHVLFLDNEYFQVKLATIGAENYCRGPIVLEGGSGHPARASTARMHDERLDCLFPWQTVEEVRQIVKFTWTDWLVVAEYWVDNWLVGLDGDSGVVEIVNKNLRIVSWTVSGLVGASIALLRMISRKQ